MKLKIILCIFTLAVLDSCTINRNITGKYRSNFPDSGFFMTEIDLNQDSTVHYSFSGDLQHTDLYGKFNMQNSRLYLRFDKLKDTTALTKKDTIIDEANLENTHFYDLKTENGIEYHLKYQIAGKKLHPFHIINDRIVKRGQFCSDKKRYIFFGPICYKKKLYLKKVD